MSKFKKDDKVLIKPGSRYYVDSKEGSNPKDLRGTVLTVTHNGGESYTIKVIWENGLTNAYNEPDLIPYQQNFKIGDMVIMVRTPTSIDWEDIGEVPIPQVLYEMSHRVTAVQDNRCIILHTPESDSWFPINCFKLLPDSPSKEDRLIAEARTRYPRGSYFLSAKSKDRVISVQEYSYDEEQDMLCDDGWAVYYKGKWADLDDDGKKPVFEVGDLVRAHHGNGYSYTTDGWEGIVVETSSDPDTEKDIKVQGINGHKECSTTEGEGWWVSSYKFDLISKGSHILSQTKTSENGKAKHDDSERVIKVSHNDFEVSRGNQIRGSRINGTASEVTIGNRHRHDEARPIRF